jgi:hypothetical protein
MQLFAYYFGFLIEKAFAQGVSPYGLYCNALGTYCGDGIAYFVHIAIRVVNIFVFPIVGGLAVIGVLYGSIKMIASFGNDQGKEDAKKIITMSVIGIALTMTSVAIVNWICRIVQLATNPNVDYCQVFF